MSGSRFSGRLLRLLLAAALGPGLAGFADAHAALSGSEPAAFAAVRPPVGSVTIRFTEAIEAAFSTFKLYRLDADVDLGADNAELRLGGLASVVISAYLRSDEEGEGHVATTVVTNPTDKAVVTLEAVEPLEPGHYVVMWRILSADTHVVDGSFVFTVLGE